MVRRVIRLEVHDHDSARRSLNHWKCGYPHCPRQYTNNRGQRLATPEPYTLSV